MISITRRIVFHSGHMLKDDKSKCHAPHGHEYVLECSIKGEVQQRGAEAGMVMHFGSLKEIMMEEIHDRLDHKFILENTDLRANGFVNVVGVDDVYVMTFPPTAENLLEWCVAKITKRLPAGISIAKIKLQETLNCWAEL